MASYPERESSVKDSNNELVTSAISKYLGEVRAVLYLDGPAMKTTISLRRAGLRKRQLYSPNIDGRISASLSGLATSSCSTMGNFVSRMRVSPDAYYFDYMGTISGSETNDLWPLEDIWKSLMKNENQTVVFASTFSARHYLGCFEGETMEMTIKNQLQAAFHQCNYIAEEIATRKYNEEGQMIFTLYILREGKTPGLPRYHTKPGGEYYDGFPSLPKYRVNRSTRRVKKRSR